MDLFVLHSLFFYIVRYYFFITKLTDCIDIVASRPELTSPEHFLYFGVLLKYLFSSDALCGLYEQRRGQTTLFRETDERERPSSLAIARTDCFFHRISCIFSRSSIVKCLYFITLLFNKIFVQ